MITDRTFKTAAYDICKRKTGLQTQRPKKTAPEPRASGHQPRRSRLVRGCAFFGSGHKRFPRTYWRDCAPSWRERTPGNPPRSGRSSHRDTTMIRSSTPTPRYHPGSTVRTVEEESRTKSLHTRRTDSLNRRTHGQRRGCSHSRLCLIIELFSTPPYYCYHSDDTHTHTPRVSATSVVAPFVSVEDRGGCS